MSSENSSAWQSYDARGRKPAVPEPGAYGAGLLALLVLIVLIRRGRR